MPELLHDVWMLYRFSHSGGLSIRKIILRIEKIQARKHEHFFSEGILKYLQNNFKN